MLFKKGASFAAKVAKFMDTHANGMSYLMAHGNCADKVFSKSRGESDKGRQLNASSWDLG